MKPGSRVGPYEIACLIGAGGMGEVYRAHDPRLHRDVAVKVLPADLATNPIRLRRLQQEARATAALNQPNVLAIYDIGDHEGRPFLVTELLEGETLRAKLERGPVPTLKALDYARQAALGLAAAHAKGVVHRDLKPDNLFVAEDGRLKILDFGLARFAGSDDAIDGSSGGGVFLATVTSPGAILGTVGYMSPEQVRGLQADARSDIFSLGVVLYEMLTGRRAFPGETPGDTLAAILTSDPPAVQTSAGDIPAGLQLVVRRCLEKTPGDRFQSAADLAIALEAASSDSLLSAGGPRRAPRNRGPARLRRALLLTLLLAACLSAVAGLVYLQPAWLPAWAKQNIGPAEEEPLIFVANANSNSVSVLRGFQAAAAASIAVGVSPHGVAFNRRRAEVYVANHGSGDVSVIDCASRRVVATIAAGAGSYGVAFSADGTRAYVSNALGRSVTFIDTASRTAVATISGLGQPQGIAVSPDGTRLYVVNEVAEGSVSVIDTRSQSETTRVPLGGSYPVGIVLTPDGRTAYVTIGQEGEPFVAVLDTSRNAVVHAIRAGTTAGTLPAITPDGSRVVIPNTGSDTASVVDTATNRVVATIPVGNGPYAATSSLDGVHAFITNANASSLSVIDLRTNTVTTTIRNLGSIPSGIAVADLSRAAPSHRRVGMPGRVSLGAGQLLPSPDRRVF